MKYFRSTIIFAVFLMLSGCQTLTKTNKQSQAAPIITIDESPVTAQAPKLLEQPPKLIQTNWQPAIQPLVKNLLRTVKIDENNQLLISDAKNYSSQYVSSTEMNKIIVKLISQKPVFNIIDRLIINQSKSVLGIPYNDSSVSRSKMLTLAKNVKADYLLFTTVNEQSNLPDTPVDVVMELVSVETGKKIWQSSTEQLKAKPASKSER